MDEKLQEHLLTNSLEGIIITDLEGTISYVNATALEMLQFRKRDLEDAFLGTVFPPSSTYHLLSNLMKLAREGVGFLGEIMLQTSQTIPIIVKLKAEVFPGKAEPEYLLFRFLDWTEVSDLINELKVSSQLAVLGNLTRSMSHEILNPVTAAGGFARKLLKSLPDNSSEYEWSGLILQNIEILESLLSTVRNFLDLPEPHFVEESVDRILEKALESTLKELKSRNIELEQDTKALSKTYLDPSLLEKAFTAVLVNAAERMENGGKLTISGSSDQKSNHVSVDDTGPPLDTNQMEEDLSPVHVMRTLQSDLNLAIAQKIISDHGGRLKLTQSHSGNLRVQISLPHDRRQISRARLL